LKHLIDLIKQDLDQLEGKGGEYGEALGQFLVIRLHLHLLLEIML
jgi:hypothetical protein